MTFYEQLEKLCQKHNIKPSNVVEQLGMSKGTMSNWKKGGTPSGEAVVRFAKHFNVSTDYLLGIEKNYPLDTSGLTDSDIHTVNMLIEHLRNKNQSGIC